MRKTYKCRLKPTKQQQRLLAHALELCRWLYNETLATRKNASQQEARSVSLFVTQKLLVDWKQRCPKLKQVHSQVLQNVQMRVDLAFKAFFRRVKMGEQPGYPRFKGSGRYNSLTYTQYGNGVVLSQQTLTLSKIGEVKVVMHRPIEGAIKTVTIQQDAFNRWSACFSCEVEPQPLPPSPEVAGVDLGLKTFAILSNGEQIKRQCWMKRDQQDISRLQRKKEKFAKGSPQRHKVVRALQHDYQRAKHRRNNFAHQESRKLVNRYGLLVFEKLEIQQMQGNGNKPINRNIADVAWGQFVQYTLYKAEDAGRAVVLVNARGTTQECSGCGEIIPKDLSVRTHDCPRCGLKVDRDLNAALNILARGLASIEFDP